MIQIRPREGSKVALFAGFIFEPGERGRQAREGEGGVREGRGESYRREIVIVNLARKAGRQSGGQGNGEERSAVRGGPLAHSLTKEPAYSSILSPHACLVKSLCQQQLHPPRGGDGRRRWREPRGSPRNLNVKGPPPLPRARAR